MTLKSGPAVRARTVGHISRGAQVRVDKRVREILARGVALERARDAALRIKVSADTAGR